MIHAAIAIGAVAALVGYAFGERAAKAFIAAVLLLFGGAALFVGYMICTRVLVY